MNNKELITIIGAGPGISKAVAEKFGKEGFRIALIGRTESKLQSLVKELNDSGIKSTYAIGDVSDVDSLKGAMFNIMEREGHADVILYNAAAVEVKDMLELDWATLESTFRVNVGGAFNLLKTVLPFCITNNKGKLFFTGGGFALGGDPEWTTLSVGKAGLRNLVQAATKKVEGSKIHIAQLTVCGFVNPEDSKYSPNAIAEKYWSLYNQEPDNYENEIIY